MVTDDINTLVEQMKKRAAELRFFRMNAPNFSTKRKLDKELKHIKAWFRKVKRLEP